MEKRILSFRTLIIGLLLSLASEGNACSYTFRLHDSYGDGWNGGYINILVNGVTVASNLTLSTGYGPFVYALNVNHGDIVSATYVAGSWPTENYFEVYDNFNTFVLRNGCTDGTCTPQGGYLFTALCPTRDVGMQTVLSPMTGCGFSSSTPVTVVVRNNGIQQIDTLIFSYSIDGGLTYSSVIVYQTIMGGDSLVYTFPQLAAMGGLGDYNCIFTATTVNDQYTPNDTLVTTIKHIATISSFPYFENFESGAGGWYAGGANSSWAFGNPNSWTISSAASGSMAWVTNLTGGYNNNEASWVSSPCYDFTGMSNMIFEMKLWYETYQWYDGAALQYTLDGITWVTVGNQGDPVNWYNNTWMDGLVYGFGISSGWSGYSNQYLTVNHVLPVQVNNQPSVRFRVVFGSTAYHWGGYDGVAFDDVRIYQPPPMTVSNFFGFQSSVDPVGKGMSDASIIGFNIQTNSTTNPLVVHDIRFNTTGTTNSSDIAMARLWYTSNQQNWSNFGQDVKPLSPFGFQDTLTLQEGNNFFVLVYDVDTNATTGNFLDAEIDSVLIGGIWMVPTNNNPAGSRVIQPPMSGTYIVNHLGGADFINLNEAREALLNRGVNGPVEIAIMPGIYQEKVTFDPVPGASATNTITIRSFNNDSTSVTIQDSALDSQNNWVIRFRNASHITLKNLSIIALSFDYGRAITLAGNTYHIKILNNYLQGSSNAQYEDTWLALIFSEGTNAHLEIQNNRLYRGSYGVCLMSWYNPSSFNIINHNVLDQQYAVGLHLEWLDRPVAHGNLIESASGYNYFKGIQAYSLVDTFRITGNTIRHQSNGMGIFLTWCENNYSGHPAVVANNFVASEGLSQNYDHFGIYSNFVTNTQYVFNSINLYGQQNSSSCAMYFNGNHSNVMIKNNAASNRTGGGYAIRINSTAGVQSDYNNFFHTGAVFGRYNNIDAAGFNAWQFGTGFDASSKVSDPMFFTQNDLHTFSPILNNAGTPITGILYDIDGELRDPLTPDIGADEFTMPAQEAAFVGFLSPAGGCGLGLKDVKIRIANNGTSAISGGLTAYYQIQGGSLISEAVPGTIQPGDTLDFTFTQQANLAVLTSDSTFEITGYISLTGDPLQFNDTGYTSVWSGYLPPAPVPNHVTVNYGNIAGLSATGPGIKKWFLTLTDSVVLHIGDTLLVGPLYDTATYYVESHPMLAGSSGQNVALLAVASHSSGGAGTFGPANYNDGVIPAYPNQPWGWVSDNGWIEYIWPAPVTFNSVKFHKADRWMSSCTFQWWDGSSYVNFYNYVHNSIDDSVTFPLITTTRLRFFNVTGSNPNFREIQVFAPIVTACPSARVAVTAFVTAFPGADAGITSIQHPMGSVLAGTPQPIEVMLKNFGLNTLTNVTISWRLNNVLQTPYTWTGNLAHGASVPVTIATHTFNPGQNCIKVWTTSPNGLPDNFNQNDTGNACFNGCLSGTYTIGPAAQGAFDFNSFTAAVNTLAAGGVCGPVIFEVHPSTYTEQLTIPVISGTSSANTVIFRSATQDSTAVLLQFAATSSANNWVVRFSGASHLVFSHMTIRATGISNGRVIEFMNGASNIRIDQCFISTNTTSTSTAFAGFYSTSNAASNNITINQCKVDGGYYGIYHYAVSSVTKTGLTVSNCLFTNFYLYGIYTYYTNNIHIEGNTLINRSSSTSLYPMYFGYNYLMGAVSRNRIISVNNGTYYGIWFAWCEGGMMSRWQVTNNMISHQGNSTSTAFGIYSQGSWYFDFLYNSVRLQAGSTANGRAFFHSSGSSVRVLNNTFSNHNGGYAYYVSSPWAITTSNHNNFYTIGSTLALWDYDFATLTDLRNYSGQDLSSHNIQPPFYSSQDLRMANTALSGKALAMPEVQVDLFGNARTATPTIGAHEVPLLPNDAGVIAITQPDGQTQHLEDDLVPVQVVVRNFGLDTLYQFTVSYRVNQMNPVAYGYNGMLPPNGTDTIWMSSFVTPPGNSIICAYTTVSGDINTFNDTSCIGHYALSNIDAELVMIHPVTEGCALGMDTVTIAIANVATANIPSGFTASYRLHGGAVITETVNTAIPVGDTIHFTFATLVNLGTSTDTIWNLKAWVTVQNDNILLNDTAALAIVSLAAPSPPPVTSPVSTAFGTSAVLDANSLLYTEWHTSAAATNPVATGSVYQTPLLYDTTTYFAAQFYGSPLQNFTIGTSTHQNSTTGYPTPYGNWYYGNKEQYLIRASELTAQSILPGEIHALAFNVISPQGAALQNYTIKMGHSSLNEFSNVFATNLTTVYAIPSYTDVAGWNAHNFQTPFVWDGVSNLIIETCFNNTSYTSNGVVALSESNFYSYLGNRADASGVCNYTEGGTGYYRPVMRLTSSAMGCSSVRVPVVVNVTGIPPLGKPSYTPESMQVDLVGCNGTDTKIIKVKNIGNAALTYQTYGGSHAIDTTSTQYFHASVYPDTTTHLLTTLPTSIDSLYLEITINGYYSTAAAFASLIIEGNNLGAIPDGDISYGVDITRQYAFGGTQLANWLSDGELSVRIGNSSIVYPYYGTRMHRVRAYTKPAPWATMSQTTGSIAIGDSASFPVVFSGAGLIQGSYYANLPIKFSHPGYPYAKIPVNMTLTGAPDIHSAACLNITPIFQYNTITDSVLLYNQGCAPLNITAILNSDTTFTPGFQQATIAPFDSMWLPVAFSPLLQQTYHDTLVIKSNDADHYICLQGIGLSPPAILLSTDTLYATITGCNDTLSVPLTIQNTGNAQLTWVGVSGISIADPFDNGLNTSLWASTTGIPSGSCGSFSAPNALYFDANGMRHATTVPLNLLGGGSIDFHLKIANGSWPCEMADWGEDVVLEYSKNQGSTWINIATYYTGSYPGFTPIAAQIPTGARTSSTMLRWRQVSHSGSSFDHWAIDNVAISNAMSFVTITPDTGTVATLGQQTIQVLIDVQQMVNGTYTGNLVFLSNDPLNPQKELPFTLNLIGTPNLVLQPFPCLTADTTQKGGVSNASFTIFNDGCDTLYVQNMSTGTLHFSTNLSQLMILPFQNSPINLQFHPMVTGAINDTLTIMSNDGLHQLCLTGIALPAPEFIITQNSLNVTIQNCNDSMIVTVPIANTGQADLHWALHNITGNMGMSMAGSTLKIGVYNSPDITSLLNTAPDIQATNIGSMDNATISQYDAIMNIRGNNINQNDVLTYIQAGGSWIGEWHSNDYPFIWGAIAGNIPQSGTGGTYGASVLIPGHYLAQKINWAGMPFGANPTDFMRDLRNLNDPQAQIIVSANHYSYPNNPLLVEKKYGSGKIILLNWDYADNPYYNATVSNMIIETARYAALKANWISIVPTQGVVAPAGSQNISVKFNALGLPSGVYTGKVRLQSNDPLNPADSILCTMTVIGAPDFRISHQAGCLDYDTLIQGFNTAQTLWVYNDGCDTLFITSITKTLPAYTLSAQAMTILPGDSANLQITFTPNAAQLFADNLLFVSNDGTHQVCLTGVGIDAPVISYTPANLSHTFMTCNDSVALPLTIYNSGIGDLRYTMTNLFGATYNQTSTQHYTISGAITNHQFANVPLISDSMKVILTINGDFDDVSEYCSLVIEGINLGIVPDNNLANGTNIVAEYNFTGQQLQNWLADGVLNIAVVNNQNVDHWSGLVSMHRVQVLINGVPWIAVSMTADTIVTGDSSVVLVTLKTAGLPNGSYQTNLQIQSNDPVNQMINIPCTLTVNGQAALTASAACLHFGTTMQYAQKKDTLILTNSGCSPLIISSIYTTLSHFTLNVSYLTIAPGQSALLIATFLPTSVGQFNDNIVLVTNAGTHQVCLTGTGADASILSVLPGSFTKSITACNDTITDVLQVQNLGTGNLTYQVYGGRGLSGDSTILVIRDAHPWNVNIEQYIQTYFGIVPDVITSSQIASTNFGLYDVVITVGNQSVAYYNTLTAQAAKFTTFANSGGIVLYMLANYSVNTMTMAGGVNMIYGNAENQNIIVQGIHPIVQGLNSPLNGSNANANYMTNLPAGARIITRTNISSSPTTAEYELGSGLVIATGMLWEYHATTSGFNMQPMMHKAISYALGTIGTSPSWLSFAYTADTLFGIGNTNVTVNFNSTGIPNGVYQSNIIVYSNDPVTPQKLIPCTLTVNGTAQIAVSAQCLEYDTVLQGSTTLRHFTIRNTGCANLTISSITTGAPLFQVVSGGTGTIAAGDSMIVAVSFIPQTIGSYNSTLTIGTNLGSTTLCLKGFSINPPVVAVSPNGFNININSCADTVTQFLKLMNTGLGNAIYHILGIYGSDIDQTSTIPFVTNGAVTTHIFNNLPPNTDTLLLEVTLSGDFDQPSEYATLVIEGTTIGVIFDGDVTAGTPTTAYYGFGGSQLSNWLSNGQLSVSVQNASTVDHWVGLSSYHKVRILINGNRWIHVWPLTDTIPSNDSTTLAVNFFSTNVNAGTHYYNMLIGSNDPGNAQVSVPCTLTVVGSAAIMIGENCLHFDSTMIGASQVKHLTITNTGCDTLKLLQIQSNVGVITLPFSSAMVMPGITLTIPVTFAPVVSGGLSGNISITSNLGNHVVCLTAAGLPAPAVQVNQTNLLSNLACALTETKPVVIRNTGQAPLVYQLSSTSNTFLTVTNASGTVLPGDSATLMFNFSKTGLPLGTYTSTFLLNNNDPLIPQIPITCTLEIPNMLVPVNLGPNIQVCANQQVVLKAGTGYASYLWDDLSTDSVRQITNNGLYHITVMDQNGCASSDTIQVTFYPLPMVDAGSDTTICAASSFDRAGNASGTIMNAKTGQVGASNTYSGSIQASPFATNYTAARRQIIYRKNDLINAGFKRGSIESIAFNLGSVGSPDTLKEFNIRMTTTPASSLSGGFNNTMTLVYSNAAQTLHTGWYTFTLNTPFFYDGMDNLVIEICFTNTTYNFGSSVQYHNAFFNAASIYSTSYNQNLDGCQLTGHSNTSWRPNMRISGQVDEGNYWWTGPGSYTSATPTLRISSATAQHAGFYHLHVDNGIGCVATDAFNLTLSPLPVVDAGVDTFIYEGGSYQQQPTITGGVPPYSYAWSPGATLDNPLLQQPVATPLSTTTYTLMVSGSNGCSASDAMKLSVVPRYHISGTFSYNNAAFTPLSNSTVYLHNAAHTIIDSVLTDASGVYTFYYNPPSTYYLSGRTFRPWGGVNATDALVVQRHVINLNPLSGLRLTGADVNLSQTVSSTDALLILRRTLGMDTTFASGDWVYDYPAVVITNSHIQKNIQGLAGGDVNGSYLPPLMRQYPLLVVKTEGSVTTAGDVVEIPVKAGQWVNLGAITMVMNLPETGVTVESVTSPMKGLMHHIHQGKLRIAWSDEQGHLVSPGDLMFTLRLKISDPKTSPFWMHPTLESEITDVLAQIMDPMLLTAPELSADNNALSVWNQPNPFREKTNIHCILPEEGTLEIEVFDLLGRSLSMVRSPGMLKGEQTFEIDAGSWPSGVYHYRITLDTGKSTYRTNHSMILTR
jgi:hypothetical protein